MDAQQELLEACWEADAKRVRSALVAGADPNHWEPGGSAALHRLCWHWDFPEDELEARREMFADLVAHGADVTLATAHDRTPLHDAAGGDSASPLFVRLLLDAGAPVNVRDATGATPLLMAVRGPSLSCVEMLLGAGADPTIGDLSGCLPADAARATLEGLRGAQRLQPDFSFETVVQPMLDQLNEGSSPEEAAEVEEYFRRTIKVDPDYYAKQIREVEGIIELLDQA